MKRLKRMGHLLLTFMFASFTILQFNDPDPLLWIAIYGSMTVLCFLASINKFPVKIILVLAAAYLVYMVILFPGVLDWYNSADRSLLFDDIAKMQYPFIEESREFLGLLICEVVLVGYFLAGRKG